jgi:hypothetical protein
VCFLVFNNIPTKLNEMGGGCSSHVRVSHENGFDNGKVFPPVPAEVVNQQQSKPVTIQKTNTISFSKLFWQWSRYLGLSTATSDEISEERQMLCRKTWKLIGSTCHHYPHCSSLRGVDLFCKMFLSTLNCNDCSDDGRIFNAFRPRNGSPHTTSASLLRRVVRYMLSIRYENRNVKQNLRSMGRTHARLKIERPEFNVFCLSFIETLIMFPGVKLATAMIEAWSSLLKFTVDQMCFDKIVFRDHYTLLDPDDGRVLLGALDSRSDSFETVDSNLISDETELFQKRNQSGVNSRDSDLVNLLEER